MAPGPTPIPPEVLLAQGSPLVYHRGPGFGKLLRDVTESLQELLTDDLRRPGADVVGHRRPGVGGGELLLARRPRRRPGGRVLRRAIREDRRGVRAGRPHGSTTSGGARSVPRTWRRALDEAPGQGRPDAAQRDLDRRDPRHRGGRPRWRATPARWSSSTSCRAWAPCRSTATRGASTWRSADRRRRCRRSPGHRVRRGLAAGVGGDQRPRRTRGSTSTGRSTRTRTTCRIPENPWTPAISVDAGACRPRCGCTSRRAPRPRWRGTSCCREAMKEGARRWGSTCSARDLERQLGRHGDPRARGHRRRRRSWRAMRADHGVVLAPGQGPLKGKVFRIGHFGYFERARHHPRPGGARDDARRAGPSGRSAGGRGRGGRDRVPGEPAGERRRRAARVLVTETLSESGPRPAARGLRGGRPPGARVRGLAEAIGPYDALIVRSQTKVTAEVLERADAPQGGRRAPGSAWTTSTWRPPRAAG